MKRRGKIAIAVAAALCAALFLFFYFAGLLPTKQQLLRWLGAPQQNIDENALLEVTVLSVGQGDCILVRSDSYAALIDAGLADSYGAIAAALDERGISRLDAVFVSHPHADHMGALRSILQNYAVEHIYFADIPAELTPTSAAYERLVAVGEMAQYIAQGARESGVPQVYHFASREEAESVLPQILRPDSTILVKASRGMRLEELTASLLKLTREA